MTKLSVVGCCLFFFFTLPALAQKEGIRFFKGSWKKALEEAKQSGRLIFVDVYTDWCAACARMEDEIFPLKEVEEKYNMHFINFRADAERGTGSLLVKEYQARRHPAYFFINGDGDLVHMGQGYNPNPDHLLTLADIALRNHAEKRSLVPARETYENRKQDKAFVKEYLTKIRDFGLPADTISNVQEQYFSLLKPAELKDSATVDFLVSTLTRVRSPVFEHIISNQAFYNTIVDQLPKMLGNVVVNSFKEAVQKNNDALFWETLLASKKLDNPSLRYPYSVFMYTNEYYVRHKQVKRVIERAPFFLDRVCQMKEEEIVSKDRQQFDELMRPYVSGEKDSTMVYNFSRERESWRNVYSTYVAHALIVTADIFLENTRNKNDLKKACIWAEKAVELDKSNYRYYPVLSRLYAKTGMKREAITAMQTCITLAQEQRAPGFWVAIYKKALQEL